MATIGDRTAEVLLALGNRSDLTTRVYKWLWESYCEIAQGINFEEQEVQWDNFFQVGIDSYDYDVSWKAVKQIMRYNVDGKTGAVEVVKKDIRNINQMGKNPGPPTIWAARNRQIIVRAIPDQNYAMHVEAWVKPQQDPDAIQNTILLLPDDWLEVVDMGAILRGHMKLLERNKALEVRQILYGDPKHPADKGLIERKKLERQAGYQAEEWNIRPRILRYTNTD